MNNIDQLKQEVKQILNEKPILMDSFDSSYLNDFHHILKENFSITNVKDSKLKNILNLLDTPNIKTTLELRDNLLKILDEGEFFPNRMSQELRNKLKHHQVSNFSSLSNVTSQESKEKAKEFLIGYSQLQGGGTDISLTDFERNWGGRTLEMRHKLNSILTEEKENKPDIKMLTLGPRWPAEITYIREKFGIDAMGLDLFSIDESKIIIGDMHEMPFEDNSYDIVYEKNTYNKSYDFRKALDESVRVLKPGESTGVHRHEGIPVVYMIEGEITITSETREIQKVVKKGEAFIGSTNDWHETTNTGNVDAVAQVVFIGATNLQNTVNKD